MEDHPHLDTLLAQQDVPLAYAERLALLVVRAGTRVAAFGDAALQEELAISGRNYTALAVIERDQPSSQLELARLMGKAPAMCVGMLDELEAEGLVARVRDPKDRRRSIVSLTDAGRRKLAEADTVARRIEREVLGDLSDGDRALLHRLLGGAGS